MRPGFAGTLRLISGTAQYDSSQGGYPDRILLACSVGNPSAFVLCRF